VDDGDLRLEIEELRAARRRLVATADAERRRIEGDLHDGVQQHLVALAVNLQLARQLAAADPFALMPLLDEIGRDVGEALDDVRRLASRVYPATLLDRGLVEALRAAASEAAIAIRVEAPQPVERYPTEIEAAAYFCCVEALAAAALHPNPPERAIVRLRRERHALVIDVIVESGHDPWGEHELLAIGDRLGAVGGRLTAPSETAEGSRLSGTIPLDP
jgi:signal transduction histidine kinase